MWFIIALAVGVAVTALVMWSRSRDVVVKWYEWLIGAIGLALLLLTIQNSITAIAEVESQAAGMYWLILGLPAVILLAVAWQLIARRQRSAG